jgi:hypothetical protein
MNEESREAALRVRKAEKPFIIINVPSAKATALKWNDTNFLSKNFGRRLGNVEKSESAKFLYWTNRKQRHSRSRSIAEESQYPLPQRTSFIQMSWRAFLEEAKKLDVYNTIDRPHFYWHTNGNRDGWIKDDLELFDIKDDFFIVDKSEYTVPIACRVGTKGLCNEMHYDTHRTFAAQLVGSKRWIFLPPSECSKLYLYPNSHPSARHTAVDINSGHIDHDLFPLAGNALAIETVIHAGEVAYLPSNWFHHIISQEFNIQCIARSGHSLAGDEDIEACGFAGGKSLLRKK